MRSVLDAIRKISIFLAALLIAGYIGNLLIDNPFFNQVLKGQINKKLEDYTFMSVRFEAISARVLPLSLDIYGLDLRKKAEVEEVPLFQAKHVQVRLSLSALFLSRNEIFEVEVNGPQLELPLPPLKELLRIEKFPDLDKPSELPAWPLNKDIPLRRISWTNASLKLRVAAEKPEDPSLLLAELGGFDLNLIYNGWNDVNLDAEIRQFDLKVEGKHLIKNLEIKTSLQQKGEKLESQNLEMRSAELELSSKLLIDYETASRQGSGSLPLSRQLRGLFVRLSSEVHRGDIAILGRFLTADETQGDLQGKADLQLHLPLDERESSWKVEGSATSKNATLAGFKLLNSELNFSIDDSGMNFEQAKVYRGSKLLAQGRGFLGFSGQVPFEYDIVPVKLSLGELLDVLTVENFDALSAQIVSENVHISGQAEPFEIKISGLADFKDLTFPFVEKLPARFTEAPDCLLQTALTVKGDFLSIDAADGSCSQVNAEKKAASPLHLKGKIGFSEAMGLDLEIDSPQLDATLLEHYAKFPASGVLQSRIQIKGPYERIVIGGQLRAKSLNFGGFAAQTLQTQFNFDVSPLLLNIKNLSFTDGNQGRAEVRNARFGIEAPYPFKAEVDIEGLSSEFFHEGLKEILGEEKLSFALRSLQGQLEGPLLEPFRYRGRAHFVVQNLRYGAETFFHESSGTVLGEGPNWQLDGAYVRLDQLEMKLDAALAHIPSKSPPRHILHELGIGPSDLLRLEVKTLNKASAGYRTNSTGGINHLASLPYIGPFIRQQRFGAEIHLESDLEGTVDHLQGKIEASLEQPFIWGIPISSLSFSGFISGSELFVPEIRHSGNALAGRLKIDFGKKGLPYDWYLYLNQLDIRAFLGHSFADDPRNFAYLSAEWTMKGELENFWDSSGELVLSRLRSKLFRSLGSRTSNLELNSDQPIKVDIRPRLWRLADKRPLKLQGEFFKFEITAGDNRLPEELDIGLRGSFKLDIIKGFTPLVDTARGELMVEGYIKGSLEKPDISIRIRERKLDPFNMKDWNPVTIGVLDYGPAFTGISLDVEAKSDRIIVHRFRANKGREGSISASGVVSLGEEQKELTRLMVELDRIEFNRLNIPVLKTADLVLSGDLALSGNSLPFHLSGNLKVDRFHSVGNFDLRRELVSSLYETRMNASVNKSANADARPLFNLDVAVSADRSISIKTKSLEALMSANLRVRGNELEPLLLGQIIADRGTFNYRRLFKISQAVLSFDEPVSPPNPRLDIVGETTVNPYEVQVMVNGNLSNPRVTLSCDPPNRDDGSPISNLDIVLLITTGKIPEQANKTAEKASVNEIFSSFLVFAEEPIEKLFDLSGQTFIREVYIDSYLSEAEERPVTRLNVPFNLWGMANAVVQVDDDANAKLSFEYPIHEGITLSGSLDSKKNKDETVESPLPKDTGFDLKFRFGFD